MLCSRLVKFRQTLISCKKPAVRILARICETNSKTVFGNNLVNIARECDSKIEDLTATLVKTRIKYMEVPLQHEWKIGFVKELIMIISRDMMVENFSNQEFNDLIDYLCTS